MIVPIAGGRDTQRLLRYKATIFSFSDIRDS